MFLGGGLTRKRSLSLSLITWVWFQTPQGGRKELTPSMYVCTYTYTSKQIHVRKYRCNYICRVNSDNGIAWPKMHGLLFHLTLSVWSSERLWSLYSLARPRFCFLLQSPVFQQVFEFHRRDGWRCLSALFSKNKDLLKLPKKSFLSFFYQCLFIA